MKAQLFIVFVFVAVVTLLLILATAGQEVDAKTDVQSPLLVILIDHKESWQNPSHLTDLGHTSSITFTPAFTVYLPSVLKMTPGIYGKVTYQGLPISGVSVQLLDNLYTKVSTVTTQSDGSYLFASVPSPPIGQSYWVRYFNSSGDKNYLLSWKSFNITIYITGNRVAGGDFDIANILPVSPASGATVALPCTFQWTPRIVTPTDSYSFILFDPNSGDLLFSSPALGYVSTYTLNSLPTSVNSGVEYSWSIKVYGSDGGLGQSLSWPYVTFSGNGAGSNGDLKEYDKLCDGKIGCVRKE
jgi:hypothetical protein